LATAGAQQLSLLALHEQDGVNTVFNAVEERELSELRLLSAAVGIGDAIAAGDSRELTSRLLPLIASQLPTRVEVVVVNQRGDQVLGLQADPAQPDRCICVAGGGQP